MQNSFDTESDHVSGSSVLEVEATPGERVFTEPIDELGHILLETRIAPDGTKRTRKITRKGWPVFTRQDRAKMKSKYPPERG